MIRFLMYSSDYDVAGIVQVNGEMCIRDRAYCETCAAIGNVYVNYRLFLLHGEAKYYDEMCIRDRYRSEQKNYA